MAQGRPSDYRACLVHFLNIGVALFHCRKHSCSCRHTCPCGDVSALVISILSVQDVPTMTMLIMIAYQAAHASGIQVTCRWHGSPSNATTVDQQADHVIKLIMLSSCLCYHAYKFGLMIMQYCEVGACAAAIQWSAACMQGALGWELVHVIGHSMGAMVATQLASMHPERFLSLTLISATAGRWQSLPTNWAAIKYAWQVSYLLARLPWHIPAALKRCFVCHAVLQTRHSKPQLQHSRYAKLCWMMCWA